MADDSNQALPPANPTLKSDLGVRTLSAIVMLAIALTAAWLGGVVLDAFIALVALAALGELVRLVLKAGFPLWGRVIGVLAGAAYILLAAVMLIEMEVPFLLFTVLLVIGIDVGAYLVGRKFGRHKIAPKVSPSKSWEGLAGAMAVAGLVVFLYPQRFRPEICNWYYDLVDPLQPGSITFSSRCHVWYPPFEMQYVIMALFVGAVFAMAAQAGDFLESWLKRRAGVKDSSKLIPGHGGVFDRVDGLIPVAIIAGFAHRLL